MRIRELLSVAALCAATPIPVAAQDSNPPWFPSLMAFEHHDSARTKLFDQAQFTGSFAGGNMVTTRVAPDEFLTPYNVVYQTPDTLFVYGGGYGDKGGEGAFVARLDPTTLQTMWRTQLINTVQTNEWDYPGVVSMLQNGSLYAIYGYHLAKLDPSDGHVIGTPVELPTLAEPRDTSYNGMDALPDGTIIAKTVYRQKGCEEQGFSAFLNCEDSSDVPNSVIVAIDPETLAVIDKVEADEFIGGRITSVRFNGKDYVYLAGATKIFRYLYENKHLTLDTSWGPVTYLDPASGQTPASAVVVMNDWVVFENNAKPVPRELSPPPSPWLSVFAINQADASKMFVSQPFKDAPTLPGQLISFSPSAVSVDPARNRIFALDAGAGRIGVLALEADGLHTVWVQQQRTTEFLALIGPEQNRVVVSTAIPLGETLASHAHNRVIWRNAENGDELARSHLLPTVSTGSMVEPGYDGRMYYMGQKNQIIELTVAPSASQD
jgi:hypothetical protein